MRARQLHHIAKLFAAANPSGGGAPLVARLAPAAAARMLAEPPPGITRRDHAIMLLHIAAEIEHALMVQYLFAAYSLGGDQVPVQHRPTVERWRNSILAVAREEMGHLLTVQNVLHLIGGPVSLDREDYPWDTPFYPAPFRLAPLTRETLAVYVYAEMPADWRTADWKEEEHDEIVAIAQAQARASDEGPRSHGSPVGVVYQALIEILGHAGHIDDGEFRAASGPGQASWDEWGRGYRGGERGANVLVDLTATRDEALYALHRIAHQGEAPGAAQRALEAIAKDSHHPAAVRLAHRLRRQEEQRQAAADDPAAPQDPSHFERFLEIYREFPLAEGCEGWRPAGDIAINPTVTPQCDCTEITAEPAAHWARLFNLRYRMLLAYLSHALLIARQQQGDEPPGIRGVVMHRVFAEMYNLKTLAGILMRRPATDGGEQRAGPPFQMPWTLDLPAVARDRWRLHRELIIEARSLHPKLLRLAPRPEESEYLSAMADIDRRTETWLGRLVEGAASHRRAQA